jgi:uncharacterized membrane protein YidH (DUF202 family)
MKIQNFSKFLHGTAKLHRERTKKVPQWFAGATPSTVQKPRQPQQPQQQQQQGKSVELREVHVSGGTDQTRQRTLNSNGQSKRDDGNKTDSKVHRKGHYKIKPKTHFANERTLLQWVSASVLVMTGALALINFSDPTSEGASAQGAKLAGYLLSPVPILILAYALAMYYIRTKALSLQEGKKKGLQQDAGPWSDKFGPPTLVLVLCVVMIGTFLTSILASRQVGEVLSLLDTVEAIPVNDFWSGACSALIKAGTSKPCCSISLAWRCPLLST